MFENENDWLIWGIGRLIRNMTENRKEAVKICQRVKASFENERGVNIYDWDGEAANIQERVNKLKVEESKLSEKIVEGKKKMKKINSKT